MNSGGDFPYGMSHFPKSVMSLVETVTSTVEASVSIVTVTEIRTFPSSRSVEPEIVTLSSERLPEAGKSMIDPRSSLAAHTRTTDAAQSLLPKFSSVPGSGNYTFTGLQPNPSSMSRLSETLGSGRAPGLNFSLPQTSFASAKLRFSASESATTSITIDSGSLPRSASIANATTTRNLSTDQPLQSMSSYESSTISRSLTSTLATNVDTRLSAISGSLIRLSSTNSASRSEDHSTGKADPTTLYMRSTTTIQPANIGNLSRCSTRLLTTTSTIVSRTSQLNSDGTKAEGPGSNLQTGISSSTVQPTVQPHGCFSSSDDIPQPLSGIVIDIAIHAIIDRKICDVKACIELCLSSSACRSMSHTGKHCSLLSIDIGLDIDITTSPAATTKYWSRCPWTMHERRQLGFLDPILSPITTALPLAPIVSIVEPVLSQLAPVTSVLSILEPLTTLAAVVKPVASLLDPVLSAVDPIATPIVSVLGPVESVVQPIISVANPALSGIISAVLPAVTPIPSLLDPLIPVVRTALSNVDAIATDIVNPVASGLAPVASGIVSILEPIASGIQPVETEILSPVGSILSGAVDGLTSAVLPIATPLLSGVLSGATQVGLPIATPIICDVVASDAERGLLGLNAGCIRGPKSTTDKSMFASAASVETSNSGRNENAASQTSANPGSTTTPAALVSSPTSAQPCVVTVLVQEYHTLYQN